MVPTRNRSTDNVIQLSQIAEWITVDLYAQEMAAAKSATTYWHCDRTYTALCRVGRNLAPSLMVDLRSIGVLGDGVLTALVGDCWSGAEFPENCLDRATWRILFSEAGFTIEGRSADRPAGPMRLYRGSVLRARAGWSWTANLEVAKRYASGKYYHRPVGAVWTSLVEPARLLACNHGRREDEFVVDTDGLTISMASLKGRSYT